MNKILLIGSGGREHSLAKYLSISEKVEQIFVLPGNVGTDNIRKCRNLNLSLSNYEEIVTWCKINTIYLVVVGPEEPLIKGLADVLLKEGIACFGPQKDAASLEGSKHYGKQIMQECDIATATYKQFTDANDAVRYLESASETMRVVKADGLAAGKGVVVAGSLKEAMDAAKEMLDEKNPRFGNQNRSIIIEELLEGPEISVLAFTDGHNVRCFPASQDHKRIYDNDKGPNTGGMGAYCPCDLVDESFIKCIEKKIVEKVIRHMESKGCIYQGLLYVGLILTEEGPYVLEFNCRFGDPETQVVLPLLKSDLFEVMKACTEKGGLEKIDVQFHKDRYALCVVMTSGGYPEAYENGFTISGLDKYSTPSVSGDASTKYVSDAYGVHVIHAGTKLDSSTGKIVTQGGRVLGVVAVDSELEFCYNLVMVAVSDHIDFQGRHFRKDIGARMRSGRHAMTYANAGVSIEAGDRLVEDIKTLCGSSSRRGNGVMSDIGQFGAMFDLRQRGFLDPVLVSGTDGVGTKLKIATAMNQHKTIGRDLVAMCVNDIICHGATPLFFLDYYATGRLCSSVARDVIAGISAACDESGCPLIGGETAEMPGMYGVGDYDLAGFVVGAVEKQQLLPRLDLVEVDDAVIGLPSSGLHSNGFSFVRKVLSVMATESGTSVESLLSQPDKLLGSDQTLGEVLLTPTRLYTGSLLELLRDEAAAGSHQVRSLAHITGGGLVGNLCRALPVSMCARLWLTSVPPIFRWLWQHCAASTTPAEFARTFNLGFGMVLVVASTAVDRICARLEGASVIGRLHRRRHDTDFAVVLADLDSVLIAPSPQKISLPSPKQVAVLISGSGTNLEALLRHQRQTAPHCAYRVHLVVSNVPGVAGLQVATRYGVPHCLTLSHRGFSTRTEYEETLQTVLDQHNIELLCLAGFMRVLGAQFVAHWRGRAINVHPSLLPAFRGAHAHREVLASGVKVTGATVHFVVEEVDSGGIISQAAISVLATDTEKSLAGRVKSSVEHCIFPQALDSVAREHCCLAENNKVVWQL